MSNPSVMVAAALVAKAAVERGLQSKPWVKTTLAPGSKVVMDYYDRAGLTPYLDKLGFNLVGYGCTTCIGNSGPLDANIEEAVVKNDLITASVLSLISGCASINAASRLFAAVIAWRSPVKCRFRSSIGTTCA